MKRFAPWLCVVSLLVGCSRDDSTREPGGLSASPTSISFGNVFVGSSGAETVVLSNLGRTLVRVTVGTLPTGYRVQPASVDVPGKSSVEVTVSFHPEEVGASNGDVVLNVTSAKNETVSISVEGEGVGGLDSLAAQPVDFGTRPAGSEGSLPLVLHNVGDLPISIASLDLEGSFDFSISDERAVVLAPGEVTEYTVVFRAGDELGERTATVRFRDPDGNHRPEVVPLRATVGGIRIVSSPEGVDFGRQPSGVKARKTIALENLGEGKVVHLVGPAFEDGSHFTLEPGVPAAAEGPGGWRIDATRHPVSFVIAFESAEAGNHTDALTFLIVDADGTLSAEQSEVRIPIVAQAIEPLPCDLEVDPREVRFGAVSVWASGIHAKDLSVTNVGTTECFLWGAQVQASTSEFHFETETRFDETYFLGPGESLKTRIRYVPRQIRNSIDEAFFVFQQPGGEMRTRVTGQEVGFNLTVDPHSIVHGFTLLGEKKIREFSISNRGGTAVSIDGIHIEGNDEEFFGVDGSVGVIEAGATTVEGQLHSWFEPTSPGALTAQLEISVQGVEEPVLVEMRGFGTDELCRECVPIAECPAPITVTVNNTHEVRGSGASPRGHDLRCLWSVVQAPSGSRAEPGEGCTPRFTPDIAGDYVLELRVTDDDDARYWDSCLTRVSARGFGGIRAEMFWDKAGNIDLHVLNETMGSATDPASWGTSADCHYANPNPIWDAGFPGASPSLDRDDTNTGPENIRIPTPAPHGSYAVGVHNMSNSRTPVEITTNIFCGGTMVDNVTTISRAPGEFFVLGSIDDKCRWTRSSTMWTDLH